MDDGCAMKALGEVALDLPWLAPGVASLVTLARPQPFPVWTHVRHDPGAVLLIAQAAAAAGVPFRQSIRDGAPLELALKQIRNSDWTPIDWQVAGPADVHAVCLQQARLAEILAGSVGDCDPLQAWACGLLAPLGWLALCAVAPARIPDLLAHARDARSEPDWQRRLIGLDMAALTRRLVRLWRLPPAMASVLGNLGLQAHVAQGLGAPAKLFHVTQTSVLLAERVDGGLGQFIAAAAPDLSQALNVPPDLLDTVVRESSASVPSAEPTPLELRDVVGRLLEQAHASRRDKDVDLVEPLQDDLDRLHDALQRQAADEEQRLHVRKLASLAELAGGAGHEINNPLAVISGQAQYLLKQMQHADEQLEEDPSPALYVDALRTKFQKALQTILGQTQRIHLVLKDLIQFARPAKPNLEAVSLRGLLHEAAASLRSLAEIKKIQLDVAEPEAALGVRADAGQARTALGQLVRNALEAAAPEGWVGIGFEQRADRVLIVVQDNGPGPAPAIREHLFDPFFSGRSAGRGRGLGLCTAWRLAREQGGDVRFEDAEGGLTRFVLELPKAELLPTPRTASNAENAALELNPALHLTE